MELFPGMIFSFECILFFTCTKTLWAFSPPLCTEVPFERQTFHPPRLTGPLTHRPLLQLKYRIDPVMDTQAL
ncbi:MAG: hypothetical protein Q7U51_01165 [Methanoregula sp.]|nr:hypothetical protein [Methanoregula sp.]